MKKLFKLKLNLEFEVEADSKDEAYIELEERFASENTNANNQFWDNLNVVEVGDVLE